MDSIIVFCSSHLSHDASPGNRRSRADAEKALAQMSGAMLGSRRIRCGWAQHKQETSSASYAAIDRVCCQSCSCVLMNCGHPFMQSTMVKLLA